MEWKVVLKMAEYIERERAMQIAFTSPFFSNALMEEIKAIPSADVAPVIHSKWEICCDGYYPYCLNCKAEPPGREMTKYCPNCGAKMDKNWGDFVEW